MNRQIARLGVLGLVLIVALIAGTTYWQTWAAGGLADKQDNAIQRVAQFKIKRGLIYASDGKTVLASDRKKKVGGQTLWFRTYPTHGLAAHVVGYSTVERSRTGVERSFNDYLTASNGNLNTAFRTTLDKLKGVTVTGNNVVLSIQVKAQQVAESALRGQCGAVVALDPRTGAVLAMASSPSYDPNLMETAKGFKRAQRSPGYKCGAPLLDRATQGLYPPGSTFKTVTATAALDTGAFRPDSVFTDPGYCTEYGKKVFNAGNPDQNGPETYGQLTLAEGFEHSVNSVYCNIGKRIGAGVILEYTKRFGFYADPPVNLPPEELSPSGLYFHDKLWYPKDPATEVDPGRLAFGQERMLVTPLQMAQVAASVANGGVEMRPYVVSKITSPTGATVLTTKPEVQNKVMKPQTAAELNQMMQLVTTGGTAAAAFRGIGIPVAGKTGTAETGLNNVYIPWFICFAPADHPRVAVAVVVENKYRGFGGGVAAPIARQMLQAILGAH
ncbi:MAG TPA: penicillin-binding transpeptidase domain-containing protein [Gaiellaceae bacterium]|nr:penicillin-binding transpeptidase domain-containing protein [Gaiellaceae bacterium]